ncbi:hypothetical protein ABIE63_002752 [Limibacillus sp. MBR-115]|jgi:hypothetical protein
MLRKITLTTLAVVITAGSLLAYSATDAPAIAQTTDSGDIAFAATRNQVAQSVQSSPRRPDYDAGGRTESDAETATVRSRNRDVVGTVREEIIHLDQEDVAETNTRRRIERSDYELGNTDQILRSFRTYPETSGTRKMKTLPPGIAKNLERGKPLPPGIARTRQADGIVDQRPYYRRGDWSTDRSKSRVYGSRNQPGR